LSSCKSDRTVLEGSTNMPCWAEDHLRSALTQMDLLLASEQVDAGLGHLLAMLEHLRALRRAVA